MMQKQQNVPVDELFDCDDETAYREMLRQELAKNWEAGYCQMPDQVRHDRALSPKAKIIYEQLLFHMRFPHKQGGKRCGRDHCWPSQETLAQECGYSRRTVIRACKELYERGYIEKWRRGQGHSNYYFINPLSFPRSFRRTTRERSETMLLDVRALIRQEDCTSSTPRPLDTVFSECQNVTPASDNVSHPEVTTCHPNQIRENQIHRKEMDSNDSSPPQKGTGFPVVTQATRNEQESQTASHNEQTTPIHQEPPESALQQWHNTHYANRPDERDQERHATASTPNNEPGRIEEKFQNQPSKQPNSSARSSFQGHAPEHAKKAKDVKECQMQHQIISQATGIPQHHLEEMGIATTPAKRPIPEFIRNMISHFSRELGDNPWCEKSNITQATKLYFFVYESLSADGYDPEDVFLHLLYKAKEDASHVNNVRYRNHEGRINRMPVFFTCLKNEMQLSEEELVLVRNDELLYEPAQVR